MNWSHKSLFRKSKPTRRAFTLIEILCACAVLTIILGLLFQMMAMMSKTWVAGRAKTENAVKARAMLDLATEDIAASVSRGDLPAFRDESGNPALIFYTRRQGVVAQGNADPVRPLSLISYRYDPADDSLDRHDLPIYWNSTSGPFNREGKIADASALSGQPSREILPGVVTFCLAFLAGDQSLSRDYRPPDASNPYYDPALNANAPSYDVTKVSRAVAVSVAVVDSRTLDLLKSTGALSKLQSAAFWKFTEGQTRSLLADWQDAIAQGKLIQEGMLPAVAANLLVLERLIPLPDQP